MSVCDGEHNIACPLPSKFHINSRKKKQKIIYSRHLGEWAIALHGLGFYFNLKTEELVDSRLCAM